MGILTYMQKSPLSLRMPAYMTRESSYVNLIINYASLCKTHHTYQQKHFVYSDSFLVYSISPMNNETNDTFTHDRLEKVI